VRTTRFAAAALASALAVLSCQSIPGPPVPPRAADAPAGARNPFSVPPAANHQISVTIDLTAAQEIVNALSKGSFDPADLESIKELTAVRMAIQDAGRETGAFERDFEAAFAEEARPAVYDLRGVRESAAKWKTLLAALDARRGEIATVAAQRAAAILPAQPSVSARITVLASFGLAGMADTLVISGPGTATMVVDLSRSLGEFAQESDDTRIGRLTRLIAVEAFREAWSAYREASPAWRGSDPKLGAMEPLLRTVAENGPVALTTIDEAFFPLAVWLRDPGSRSIGEINRLAERLTEGEEDLQNRLELQSEVKKPDFGRRTAGPAGAFLADGILQASGIEGLRQALHDGPRAFFAAYSAAVQKDRTLIPLSSAIEKQVQGPASPPAP
jgi:hypothetical protein